jgi:hypothetical protein
MLLNEVAMVFLVGERERERERLRVVDYHLHVVVCMHEKMITYMISSDGNPGGKGFATFVVGLPFFWARQQLEERS